MSAYRVALSGDGLGGGWVAECLDLLGVMGQGETEREALADVHQAILAHRARVSVLDEGDDFDGYDDGPDYCERCDGEGIEDCLDPLNCDARHCDSYQHECQHCGGSGLV